MMNLAFFTDCTVLADCCYVCIVCICFAYLMILFEDVTIKYAEAFSMQCWIIILVIFYSRVWYGFCNGLY